MIDRELVVSIYLSIYLLRTDQHGDRFRPFFSRSVLFCFVSCCIWLKNWFCVVLLFWVWSERFVCRLCHRMMAGYPAHSSRIITRTIVVYLLSLQVRGDCYDQCVPYFRWSYNILDKRKYSSISSNPNFKSHGNRINEWIDICVNFRRSSALLAEEVRTYERENDLEKKIVFRSIGAELLAIGQSIISYGLTST